MSEGTYALSKADENRENERLKNLEAASDALRFGISKKWGTTGWRCLEVGAGGGSIASMAGSLRRTERVVIANGRGRVA
jgi:hypothetical protein